MGFNIYDSSGRLKTNSVQTVESNRMAHPGFREDLDDASEDHYYVGYLHGGTDAGLAHNASVVYQLWYFPYNVTIKGMAIHGDDAGNTGNLRVGFYTNNKGIPGTLITASVTNMTGAGTSSTEVVTDFDLDAGWLWMGSVPTSGTVDIEHTYAANEAYGSFYVSQNPDYYGSDLGTYNETGSDLPSAASANSRANVSYIPRIGVRAVAR